MLDERSFQTASTPFNIFYNKENVESLLNKSLHQFKFLLWLVGGTYLQFEINEGVNRVVEKCNIFLCKALR